MSSPESTITEKHIVESCAIETRLPVELQFTTGGATTMVVVPGQEINCPFRKPRGGYVVPSGNNEQVTFSGCQGCDAYEPVKE